MDGEAFGVVTVDARKRLTVSGVRRMGTANASAIVCETALGVLCVKGSDLHVLRFCQEEGTLSAEGTIDGLEWKGAKLPFLKRLFK